jgi:hypothetical protein
VREGEGGRTHADVGAVVGRLDLRVVELRHLVKGVAFRLSCVYIVQGSWFSVGASPPGVGCSLQGLVFIVQSSGFRVHDSEFSVQFSVVSVLQGSWFMVQCLLVGDQSCKV